MSMAVVLLSLSLPAASVETLCLLSSGMSNVTLTSSCTLDVSHLAAASITYEIDGFFTVGAGVTLRVNTGDCKTVRFQVTGSPGTLTLNGIIDASATTPPSAARAAFQGQDHVNGSSGAGHGGRGGRGFAGINGGHGRGKVAPLATEATCGASGGIGINPLDHNYGGGIIVLNVTGSLDINGGAIKSNGGSASVGSRGGGGSGGFVHITAVNVTGTGTLEVLGGNGDTYFGGGGAAGRIFLAYERNSATLTQKTSGGMSRKYYMCV